MFRVGVWLATLVCLSLAGIEAQTPAPRALRETQAGGRLPVRRVVLYKSGVGYFEHLGRIRGDQNVTIDFTSSQLNDVLKSLTALDLDGGRVTGVSYNSEAGIDRRLGALRLPIGAQPSRAEFLSALRGARLDVSVNGGRVTGRLLSIETIERRVGDAVTRVDAISIVSDGGELRSVPLDPGVSVRIVDADLRDEVGKYLSVTASARDQDVRRLTIATAGNGERDLLVSYVSEVPVWKATYRLVLPPSGETRRPMLQGWAVVDNTIGEDWTAIDLSLVAGAPQSFIQQISQPFYLQRPIVPLPAQALLMPQTHQGAMASAGPGAIAGVVRDTSGGVLPGVTVVATSRTSGPAARAVTDSSGRYRMPNVPPGIYDLRFTLVSFRPESRIGLSVSGGMESVLNVAMQVGQLNEEMTATAGTPVVDTKKSATGPTTRDPWNAINMGGSASGAVQNQPPTYFNSDSFEQVQGGATFSKDFLENIPAAAGAQLGDLFEYRLKAPVTIRKNESALVPILAADVVAEKVSLWSPASRINRPLRAVWLTNTTTNTLDGGSFSVVDGQAFAGEGLMNPLKPGEKRLLSYAVDLGVEVTSKPDTAPTAIARVTVEHGVVIQEREERQRIVYIVRNENPDERVVVIEHPAKAGWTMGGSAQPDESTATWHRYRVPVAVKTSAQLTVDEIRPAPIRIEISSVTTPQVELLIKEAEISPALEASLREVITRKEGIVALGRDIAAHGAEIDRIAADQTRVRENMRALRGTSEERQLLQRYVKQLDDQEDLLDRLRRELAGLSAMQREAQEGLERFIAQITR